MRSKFWSTLLNQITKFIFTMNSEIMEFTNKNFLIKQMFVKDICNYVTTFGWLIIYKHRSINFS